VTADLNKDIVRRSYLVYATGNIDELDDVIAADYVDHNPIPGQGAGRDGVKAKVVASRDGLSDIHVEVDDQLAEGEKVASRITLRARHESGADVVVRLIAISQVAGGRIVAEWGIADTSGS
jgi:ketosteroid isomerase-like protein